MSDATCFIGVSQSGAAGDASETDGKPEGVKLAGASESNAPYKFHMPTLPVHTTRRVEQMCSFTRRALI